MSALVQALCQNELEKDRLSEVSYGYLKKKIGHLTMACDTSSTSLRNYDYRILRELFDEIFLLNIILIFHYCLQHLIL